MLETRLFIFWILYLLNSKPYRTNRKRTESLGQIKTVYSRWFHYANRFSCYIELINAGNCVAACYGAWCPPSKAKSTKSGAAMNTVAPPMQALRRALFRDNSNVTGERMGLLPIFEGATVEVLTKLDHSSNLLKGTRAVVERIILDPLEDMGWATSDSDEARRGWVVLQRFPRVVLRVTRSLHSLWEQEGRG